MNADYALKLKDQGNEIKSIQLENNCFRKELKKYDFHENSNIFDNNLEQIILNTNLSKNVLQFLNIQEILGLRVISKSFFVKLSFQSSFLKNINLAIINENNRKVVALRKDLGKN